uniref:Uncharacterized protein n=1 Tax=Schistocephalus solidus TaxID=70667 RepID=A0A0X3PTT2_SCHSO
MHMDDRSAPRNLCQNTRYLACNMPSPLQHAFMCNCRLFFLQKDIVPIEATASPLSSDDSDAECISSKCTLRVLCLQNFVPPTEEVGRVLLHLAVALPRLRFFHLYPAFYAFPGATEKEQRRNRSQEIVQSNAYIRRRGCNNLQVR